MKLLPSVSPIAIARKVVTASTAAPVVVLDFADDPTYLTGLRDACSKAGLEDVDAKLHYFLASSNYNDVLNVLNGAMNCVAGRSRLPDDPCPVHHLFIRSLPRNTRSWVMWTISKAYHEVTASIQPLKQPARPDGPATVTRYTVA